MRRSEFPARPRLGQLGLSARIPQKTAGITIAADLFGLIAKIEKVVCY